MSTLFLSASDVKIGDAALYALIGFVIVLLVLALLVGIFYLTGFLFQTKALSREKLFERKKKPKVESEEADEDDTEIVAAITAAIAAIYSSEGEGDDVKPEFVIRRIKRNK
ncbi:MAG: hypothetical protein HDT28_07070 [Clostridiales bacterium]|nr:hypothetical protein [Clostridiales bacterium]